MVNGPHRFSTQSLKHRLAAIAAAILAAVEGGILPPGKAPLNEELTAKPAGNPAGRTPDLRLSPAVVVMATSGSVKGGPLVYARGFLPGTYQPTVLRNAGRVKSTHLLGQFI